jgi:cytochrome P450 PksS
LVAIPAPDLASPEFKANPYPYYARLRAEAPVYRTRAAFGLTAWLVTRYDDVLRVLKDERFANDWSRRMPLVFRYAKPLTRHMLNSDPPDHTRLRTLVQKAFTPRMVERLRERIHCVCDGLLNTAESRGQMDVIEDYALPLPLTVIGELLGIPAEDRLRFHSWSRSSISASSRLDILRALPDLWLFFRHLRNLIARRRAQPRDDLISALVQAEEAGDRLNEDELQAMSLLLLIAGYETTVNLIASGTLALLQNPAQGERFRRNPALAESAIEELLRYSSPLDIANARVVREDVALSGVTIPRGSLVLAGVGSANHDETQFPDPETLDVARAPNKHLALGQGAHFCLGAPLARMEGQIALTTLFQRFPDLRLAEPAETLRWRRSLVLRGLEELPVAL